MTDPGSQNCYYEILEVSRDASPASIRVAYRRLMQRSGNHPDRGGDAATAALINKAYAVLSDPLQREDYDSRLSLLDTIRRGIRPSASDKTTPRRKRRILDPARECVFCERPHDHGTLVDADTSCSTCGSPLAAVSNLRMESSGQRAVERIGKRLDVLFFTHWGQARGHKAKTEDVSLNGLRLVTSRDIQPGQRIRLVSSLVDAVGNVTHCTSRSGLVRNQTVAGVAFVTLRFARSVGGFLSHRA